MVEDTTPSGAPPGSTLLQRYGSRLAKWLIVAGVVLAVGCAAWIATLPRRVDKQQTVLLSQARFEPGTPASLRVLVRDAQTEKPIPAAQVQIALRDRQGGGQPQVLYSGNTDGLGTADIRFQVPESAAPRSELVIETRSSLGRDLISKPVEITRTLKIFLTTDKPVYQPGQTIHLRALALGAVDRRPAAGQPIGFVVEDARGNKVFRETAAASEYGVASADFVLADVVNQGQYKIAAECLATRSEKTVTVKWYVLPKFKVDMQAGRAYYLPGETVKGRVQADYFFGKPVAGGLVGVAGSVFDVDRRQVAQVSGKTDAGGGFDFSIDVPEYLAGGGQEQDTATYTLEATVTDATGHAELGTLDLSVARQPILLDAVPESGQLRPGVENIIYILASHPDGSPAPGTVQVVFGALQQDLVAGEAGVAELHVRPERASGLLVVSAQDAAGQTGSGTFNLNVDSGTEQVLLRPDRPAYRAGDTMHLEAYVPGPARTVYLDIVKEGQTLLTRAGDTQDGRARFDIDILPELAGTLELHAYLVQLDGSIVRDTRLVVVDTAGELQVQMTAGSDAYKPGDTAKLVFQLTRGGQPVQGALGVSIVDESVFSVAEQGPGFARLYFLLEAELLKPRYYIRESLEPVLLAPPVNAGQAGQPASPGASPQRLASAQAALAVAPAVDFALRVNSHADKTQTADAQRLRSFGDMGNALMFILGGLPLLLIGVVWTTLRRRDLLRLALRPFMITLAVLILGSIVVLPALGFGLYLAYAYLQIAAPILASAAWLACLAILAFYAWRRRDEPVQVAVLLVVAYATLLGLAVYTSISSQLDVGPAPVICLVVALPAGLAGIYLLGLGLRHAGERRMSWAAIGLAALTLPTMILLATVPQFAASPIARTIDMPTAYTMPTSLLMGCAAAPMPDAAQKLLGRAGITAGASAPAAMPADQAAPAAASPAQPGAAQPPPRLRQYFPETLYWNPQAISDASGRLALDVPVADSITTWRVSAQASTRAGELGGLTAGLRVFQDFFVDIDLPVALTQGDEIAIPVSVYNYLPGSQTVRLDLAPDPWFQLMDTPSKTLTLQPNDVQVVYFRIRALAFGQQRLKVTAMGDRASDAIAREIRVVPDGRPVQRTRSDWLNDGTQAVVRIPQTAVPGTARVVVKVYPGALSQLVEGLDGLLAMPFG